LITVPKLIGTSAIITPATGEGNPLKELGSELTLNRASRYAAQMGNIEAIKIPKSSGLPKYPGSKSRKDKPCRQDSREQPQMRHSQPASPAQLRAYW
jgi:hypothetical protein